MQGQQQAAEPQSDDQFEYALGELGQESGEFDRKVDPAAVQVPDGYKVEVLATELNFPTDITFGPDGEAYVSEAGGHFYGTDPAHAPPPRILRITPDGKAEVLFDKFVDPKAIKQAKTYEEIPDGLIAPIEGVTYNSDNGLIYIAHRTRVSTLDPKSGEFKTLIDKLPAWGIFHNTKVIFDDQGRMVFGVSSQGNAGPVDFAIMKVISFYNKPEVREVPCEDVTLTGRDFTVKNGFTKDDPNDAKETGAYVPYGTTTEEGQTIKGEFWCNSAFYRANADGSDPERIAWGIRNAFHYEFAPDGRLIATNNSCNPIPGRPVYDDWETIYSVEEGKWYGWPDYCSGEPITLDRFKAPDDPQFKKKPFPHEFVLTEDTRKRLLQGAEKPPAPLLKIEPHVAAQGFAFGNEAFGIPESDILLAEYGAVIPYEVVGKENMGFQVSRINLETGERQPFMHNKSGKPASAAPGQPAPQGGGLERPLRVEFGPDGAFYLVDFGVFDVSPKPKDKKTKMSFAGTGVIWKVTRSQ